MGGPKLRVHGCTSRFRLAWSDCQLVPLIEAVPLSVAFAGAARSELLFHCLFARAASIDIKLQCTLLCEATTTLSLPVHQVHQVIELPPKYSSGYSHYNPLDAPNSTKTNINPAQPLPSPVLHAESTCPRALGTSRLPPRMQATSQVHREPPSSAVGSQYRQRKGTTVPLPGPCRRLAELGPTVSQANESPEKKKVPAVRSEPCSLTLPSKAVSCSAYYTA